MTESYKHKSKIATAISFIAAAITYLGKDGLTEMLPKQYQLFIPLIIFCAAYLLAQGTENKRVEVAEQIIHEQYNDPTPEVLNDEYECGDTDGGC